jgi:hypothetical protein
MAKKILAVTVLAAMLAVMPYNVLQAQDIMVPSIEEISSNDTSEDSVYIGQKIGASVYNALAKGNQGLLGHKMVGGFGPDGSAAFFDYHGVFMIAQIDAGLSLCPSSKYEVCAARLGIDVCLRGFSFQTLVGVEKQRYSHLSSQPAVGHNYPSFTMDAKVLYHVYTFGPSKISYLNLGVHLGCQTQRMYSTSEVLDLASTSGAFSVGGEISVTHGFKLSPCKVHYGFCADMATNYGLGVTERGAAVRFYVAFSFHLGKSWITGNKQIYNSLVKKDKDNRERLLNPTPKEESDVEEFNF